MNVFSSIAFSPDAASHLLAFACERTIYLWDAAPLRDARRIAIDRKHRPTSLSFSPDRATPAVGVSPAGAEIWLWRVGDGTLFRRLMSKKNTAVSHASFSPDGKVLAATERGGPLVLFDLATGKELDSLSAVHMPHRPIAFSPDGKTLATTGDRQALHLWDLSTGSVATPREQCLERVDGKGGCISYNTRQGQTTRLVDRALWCAVITHVRELYQCKEIAIISPPGSEKSVWTSSATRV